jgi:hypothetical protein
VLGAYRALEELRAAGKVASIGVGAKVTGSLGAPPCSVHRTANDAPQHHNTTRASPPRSGRAVGAQDLSAIDWISDHVQVRRTR